MQTLIRALRAQETYNKFLSLILRTPNKVTYLNSHAYKLCKYQTNLFSFQYNEGFSQG